MPDNRRTFWRGVFESIGSEIAAHTPLAILAAVAGLLVFLMVPIAFLFNR